MSFKFRLKELIKTLKEELVETEIKKKEIIDRINQLEYIDQTKMVNLNQLLNDLDELRHGKVIPK